MYLLITGTFFKFLSCNYWWLVSYLCWTQVQPENVTAFTGRWGNERNLQGNQRISNQSFLKHVDVNNSYMCDDVHAKCHSLAHTLRRRPSPYFIALDHQYIIIVGFFIPFTCFAMTVGDCSSWSVITCDLHVCIHMSVFTSVFNISCLFTCYTVTCCICSHFCCPLGQINLNETFTWIKKEKHFYHVICCVRVLCFLSRFLDLECKYACLQST